MSKKAGNQNRKKGSDKRKNTFNKYGKNTNRGGRHIRAQAQNEVQNKAVEHKIENNKKTASNK